MDMGIIRCTKVHYRNGILCEMVDNLEKQIPQPKITLLDFIKNLSKIWNNKVSSQVIKHCFKKAGFVSNDSDDLEDNISLAQLRLSVIEAEVNLLQDAEESLEALQIQVPLEDYLRVDDEVICQSLMEDDDIIEKVSKSYMDTVDENTATSEEAFCQQVSKPQMREAIRTLFDGFLQQNSVPNSFFNSLNAMENFLN